MGDVRFHQTSNLCGFRVSVREGGGLKTKLISILQLHYVLQ